MAVCAWFAGSRIFLSRSVDAVSYSTTQSHAVSLMSNEVQLPSSRVSVVPGWVYREGAYTTIQDTSHYCLDYKTGLNIKLERGTPTKKNFFPSSAALLPAVVTSR